ncbi:MAG: isochorismatase [Novosphingobium lindaniclasticum]|jgi:nicotinamidase-related amidase|uniref:cysteine hydrolase family protein n=1 Tax=Novosphingobium lindaniclasticum TaxID=1329895 RepID=UPI00240A271F|nr:isochorismatase family cysteine hydrolase [Novosphingobium lindaniclasticum]MDF2640429.1 isochorismatase [Novosphingobium lindaniclasticum]
MEPDTSTDTSGHTALLIIDMINRFDFEGAEALLPKAREAAKVIADLRQEAVKRGHPVIYVNDNFGEWHSERSRLVAQALDGGEEIARLLEPARDDYFVIKPQFSGFYATNLPVLLPKLGVTRLVLTGVATDICVLFTAADAHMREYGLWVPSDAVAAESDERSRWALGIMEHAMSACTDPAGDRDTKHWPLPRSG